MPDTATLFGLTPLALGFAAACTFGAALVRGLTGFGMAIILVPLLALVMEPARAVVLGILLQLLIGPAGWRIISAQADRRSALRLVLLAAVATPAGLWLLTQVEPPFARLMIALVAIASFGAVVLPRAMDGGTPNTVQTVLTGLASGLLTGFAAMPGPPVIPYYLRQPIAPATARASMMMVFFGTAIAGTLAAWAQGLLDGRLWLLAFALYAPMWIGNRLGGLAFGRIAPALWRIMVAVILGGAALSATLRL